MRTIPASELAIHSDGSVFHLHLKPEQLADRVVLVGDPARVTTVASYLSLRNVRFPAGSFIPSRANTRENVSRLYPMASVQIILISY